MEQLGRLAFRVEGNEWVAYYARRDSMEGALRLGSVNLQIVRDQARKEAFMDLMRSWLGDMIARKLGERPTSWRTQPSPEHERRGRN